MVGTTKYGKFFLLRFSEISEKNYYINLKRMGDLCRLPPSSVPLIVSSQLNFLRIIVYH